LFLGTTFLDHLADVLRYGTLRGSFFEWHN
jgi:hypothetical protein